MNAARLEALLVQFADLDLLVVGDFFLDRYLAIDPDLAEMSIETGLEARQVVGIRNQPGAAGTVTSNLRALGVGRVRALGVIGDDGQGYDLRAGLQATGVDASALIAVPGRFTPTYTKPMNRKTGREMERLDIKNRTPLPAKVEDEIIEALARLASEVDGVIALDQVQERNCGVLTDRVTDALADMAGVQLSRVFFADSRTRIGDFRHVVLKPNRDEAVRAMAPDFKGAADRAFVERCARAFSLKTGRPAFVTLGADGIVVADGEAVSHVPGIAVPPPIDIVGAGDSVSASVVSALCAGASPKEAALVGVLVSSITIQQIGTTGTATPEQVMRRFREAHGGV